MEYGQFLLDFKKKQYLKLMYVWGHSYEFDNNNNWNVIEDFCKLMGGRDDICSLPILRSSTICRYLKIFSFLQMQALSLIPVPRVHGSASMTTRSSKQRAVAIPYFLTGKIPHASPAFQTIPCQADRPWFCFDHPCRFSFALSAL